MNATELPLRRNNLVHWLKQHWPKIVSPFCLYMVIFEAVPEEVAQRNRGRFPRTKPSSALLISILRNDFEWHNA